MAEDQSVELPTLISHRGKTVVAHTLNCSTQERQADFCEFKAILGYKRLNPSKRNRVKQWWLTS